MLLQPLLAREQPQVPSVHEPSQQSSLAVHLRLRGAQVQSPFAQVPLQQSLLAAQDAPLLAHRQTPLPQAPRQQSPSPAQVTCRPTQAWQRSPTQRLPTQQGWVSLHSLRSAAQAGTQRAPLQVVPEQHGIPVFLSSTSKSGCQAPLSTTLSSRSSRRSTEWLSMAELSIRSAIFPSVEAMSLGLNLNQATKMAVDASVKGNAGAARARWFPWALAA